MVVSSNAHKNVSVVSPTDITLNSAFDHISEFSDKAQNLLWLLGFVCLVFTIIYSILWFITKTHILTRAQIDLLKRNKKYIPGIFVELNNSKEVLRYFIYGSRWKTRIIKRYNSIYNNAYGKILKDGFLKQPVRFYLHRFTALNEVKKNIKAAIDLHRDFSERKVKLKSDYLQSQYLFEIIHRPYNDELTELLQYAESSSHQYFVLTGSAGNGKTNLLCSISELLTKLNEAVIFLDSKKISGDVFEYILNELQMPKYLIEKRTIFFRIINILMKLRRKHIYIIIDAVNENNCNTFANTLSSFFNTIFTYSQVKIIVSCRNEYYSKRFRPHLVNSVLNPAFEFDLKEQEYTPEATKRIIDSYCNHFNFTGTISPSVRTALSNQLLLMRIFFEVYQNSAIDVLSIHKHEVFSKYLEIVKENSGSEIEHLLDTLADLMLSEDKFDSINISELERADISRTFIDHSIDGSILIGKRITFHESTIAQTEEEMAYFVFDEMRDYYLARRIILGHSNDHIIDGQKVLSKIKSLIENGATSAEGIAHYTYVFFRTSPDIIASKSTETLCKAILEMYAIPSREFVPYYPRHNYNEFHNLGLRIILTSGLIPSSFEIEYIQDCIVKDPKCDGRVFFNAMLKGTLYGEQLDLDTYLSILIGIKDLNLILNTIHGNVARHLYESDYLMEFFIKPHKKLINHAPERAMKIHQIAAIFLSFFDLSDYEHEERFYRYFSSLPTNEIVLQQIRQKIMLECELEDID